MKLDASKLDDLALGQCAQAVANALKPYGHLLVTAESCTGGWIAKVCTDLAGSSKWFDRGLVTYSYEAKTDLLGVSSALLVEHGAVSELVAAAMVDGARARSVAHCALSATGIAGPGGGFPDKPVGMVCFGWSVHDQDTETETHYFAGDRERIRRATVFTALTGLLDRLR